MVDGGLVQGVGQVTLKVNTSLQYLTLNPFLHSVGWQ